MSIRVLVADDQEIVRKGLAVILDAQPGIAVVGTAAGGNEERTYPWGDDGTEPLPANYAANHATSFLPVGSEPLGNGRWGHSDLGGSMWEWNLDHNAEPYSPAFCNNCFGDVSTGCGRSQRGGGWGASSIWLAAAGGGGNSETYRSHGGGLRCARSAL